VVGSCKHRVTVCIEETFMNCLVVPGTGSEVPSHLNIVVFTFMIYDLLVTPVSVNRPLF